MALLFVFYLLLLLFLLFFSVILHADLCVKYCYFYCVSLLLLLFYLFFPVLMYAFGLAGYSHQNQIGSKTPNPSNEHNFFIHSSVGRHLCCFHVLAIVNSASVNIGVHVSISILVSLGYMLSSGIIGSYGSSTPSFSRNLHTVLYSGCSSLHSH